MAILIFLYFFLLFGRQLTRRHKVNSKNKDSILLEYSPSSDSYTGQGQGLVTHIITGFGPDSDGTKQTVYTIFRTYLNHFVSQKNSFSLLLCSILSAACPHYPLKAAGHKPLFLRNCHWQDSCHPNERK